MTLRRRIGITRIALFCAAASLLLKLHGQVFINEIMPANSSTLRDEDGDFSDWFELYNAGDAAVNLDDWGITDSPKQPFQWVVRDTTIPPRGFMTVFASGKNRQPTAIAAIAPDQVGGLKVWLAADGIQVGDSAQVRTVGTNRFVKRWSDLSGAANHATQTADASQPLLIPNAINGKPALRFDGANDSLNLVRSVGTNNFTVMAVFHTTLPHEIDPESASGVGGVSGQHWLFGVPHGGDFNGGSGLSVGSNGVSAYEHGSSYMPALAVYAAPISTGFNVVTLSYAQKRPSLSLQGVTVRTGVSSPRALVFSTRQIGAGDYGFFNGDLAEVVMFDRTLTDDERRGVERYLGAKYAIDFTAPRHTNFKLSADGESLVLTKPNGAISDRVDFGAINSDVSFGRQPDGATSFLYFPQPTPSASNTTVGASELLPAVAFSKPGGFYSAGFDLNLSVDVPNSTIRYTLDGTDPTEISPLYSAPIPIRSRAGVPNGISTIPTVPGGQPPAAEVFKGTVIRARAFKPGALAASPVTQSYFVDARGRGRYSLPVLSITTDPKNFFDANIGIYVPGASGGNYSQRGDAWERPAHVELFETNNARVIAKEAGVSIHGNTSQNFAIKGLDFNSNGGRGRGAFNYRIFPDRARTVFDHFLVRPSGHDQMYTFMRDEFMQSLMHDAGMESQAARACVTFVNGEYWGLSYLKEKEDEEFVGDYGNVPTDQLDYLEGYAAAKAGDTAQYDAMIDYIATHDMSIATNYDVIQTMMEVPNYIDYKAAEIFYYRWDIGNHRLWRPHTPEGRFRWLQFDNDVGWGGFWAIQPAWNFNMLSADLSTDGSLNGHNTAITTFLLRNLLLNAQFKTAFVNRYSDLLNTTFLPANTIARINSHAAVLEPEMTEHTLRWRAPASLTEWRNNVQYLRDYANRRPAAIRQHLTSQFSLSPTATVRLAVSPPGAGWLQVNTIKTAAPTTSRWSGIYFQNLPLTFTALPLLGYRFVGWDGSPATTASFTTELHGDFTLTAYFAPEEVNLVVTLSNSELSLTAQGTANAITILETSADLQNWQPIGTMTLDSTGHGVRSAPLGSESFFYRLRLGN